MRRLTGPLVAATISVAALALGVNPASAATFGSDLSATFGATQTCGAAFETTSCLAYGVTPSSYAPFSGVVSAVRVKTADVPQGPMQAVVLRSLYQNNLANPGTPNYFCCFLEEYGPVFTPERGTTTKVPVTLGMIEDPTPAAGDGNTVARGDFLALSVLSGDAPIPAVANSNALTGFYAPAPTPETVPAPSTNALAGGKGSFPVELLMNADIDPVRSDPGPAVAPAQPAPGTPGPATPTQALPAARPVTLDTRRGRLSRRTATVPLVCVLTTTCRGTLTLAPKAPAATARVARKATRKPVNYGTVQFKIAAHKKKTVKVTLNAAGRRRARTTKRLKLYATATVTGAVTTKQVVFVRR